MAALLIFASSCTNTTDQTLKVDIVEYEAQTPLFEDAPYTFSIDMKIEWPVSGPDAESLQNMQKGGHTAAGSDQCYPCHNLFSLIGGYKRRKTLFLC